MDKINVKELFELDPSVSDIPVFLLKRNVVYSCRNIINGKQYVGETRDTLFNRWCGYGKLSHKGQYIYDLKPNRALYNAMKKYGLENFELFILEENFLTDTDRKKAEIKWIETLHTFVGDDNACGYNMNKGGNCCEHILTKEAREKAKRVNREHHGGMLAFQSKESREKSKETQYKKYGCYAMHLKENREKGFQTQRQHYGKLAFNLPESIAKAQKVAPLYRMIGNIERHIKFLKENNFEITAYNYVFNVWDTKRMWQQHIPHVLARIDELRTIPKWTEEMENIFSNLSFNENFRGIKKIIIKNT